jgi:hypothetical protein
MSNITEEVAGVTANNIPKLKQEIQQLRQGPQTEENKILLDQSEKLLEHQQYLNELSKDKSKYNSYYQKNH